jgi:hypothetical protein
LKNTNLQNLLKAALTPSLTLTINSKSPNPLVDKKFLDSENVEMRQWVSDQVHKSGSEESVAILSVSSSGIEILKVEMQSSNTAGAATLKVTDAVSRLQGWVSGLPKDKV